MVNLFLCICGQMYSWQRMDMCVFWCSRGFLGWQSNCWHIDLLSLSYTWVSSFHVMLCFFACICLVAVSSVWGTIMFQFWQLELCFFPIFEHGRTNMQECTYSSSLVQMCFQKLRCQDLVSHICKNALTVLPWFRCASEVKEPGFGFQRSLDNVLIGVLAQFQSPSVDMFVVFLVWFGLVWYFGRHGLIYIRA